MFFFHYGTKKYFGGSYDFFKSDIVDDFLQSVCEVYPPQENKYQAFFEIINQQRGEVILEDNRARLTNSFKTKHFHTFIRGEIKNEITKRIIMNGQNGSSCFF